MKYPKRLIKIDLPIKRISAHARREKSIWHGHISTLHIWWARRPLAACRAVILASLWPDPADELCPERFRKEAAEADREEERLGRIEERIEDQKLALQEAAARKGREAAVRMVRKFDSVFNPLKLNPDDSRIILHPVDYLVFSGMTSKQPLRKVIVLDRETKNPEQRAVQRSIEQAVEKGRYDWQTLRVGNDGVIAAE